MLYRKLFPLFLCVLVSVCFFSFGQDSDEDDVFELSPFEISSDGRGYRSRKTKTEPVIPTNDIGASIEGVEGLFDPQLRQAKGVRVSFAIGFYDDEEAVRRETLNNYIEQVRSEVAKQSGLHFEPGALLVPEGDRKRSRSGRRAAYTSYAHFSVSFDFGDIGSPFERVLDVRRIVGGMGIRNDVTKLFYGAANLIAQDERDTLLFGVGDRYKGFSEVDDLGALAPVVTDDLGRQLPLSYPQVAVTLVKRADRVRIEFSLEAMHADEAKRVAAIQASLAKAESAVSAVPGLRFESGAVLVGKGDGSQKHSLRVQSYYARGLFSVSFGLGEAERNLERVREVREMLYRLDFESTTLRYGVAALVVDNVDRYRGEILKAVLADLKSLDDGMGEFFEVEPRILNARVQLRQASPTEVEVWIPYSYEIISVRERALKRDLFELELEKAKAASLAIKACCGPNQRS